MEMVKEQHHQNNAGKFRLSKEGVARGRELQYDSWSFTEIRLSVQLLLLQLLKALNRTRVSLADLSFPPSPVSVRVALLLLLLCYAQLRLT